MRYLRQATAATILAGPFLDSTNGVDAETGLTPTFKVSKNGAAQAARSDATIPSHDADGYYRVVLNATDTADVGRLRVAALAAGALAVWEDFTVLSANVYDWFFGSAAPSTYNGGAVTAVTGNVGGNVVGSVGSVATGVTLAADAVTALSLAADAVTEIQSGLATAAALLVIDDLLDTEMPALTASVASLTTSVNNLPSASQVATQVWAAAPAGTPLEDIAAAVVEHATFVALVAAVDTVDDLLDTEMPALTTAVAGLTTSLASLTTAVGTVDDLLDTEMPALTTAVASLGTSVAAVSTALGVVDDFLDTEVAAIKAKTDLIPDLAVTGTVTGSAGTTTTLVGDSALSSANDFYNGAVLAFTSGTLKGTGGRRISDYVGSTRTFSFADAWPSAPADAATFVILGRIDPAS
jgi:hypothetical protein